MRVKTQIILMSLLVLTSILLIRSTSIFALPDDNCYCYDSAEAWEGCIAYCGFGGQECVFCVLQTPKGVCTDYTNCHTTWLWWCGVRDRFYYWQYTRCTEDCWLWVNQFWKTNRVEDIFPSFLVKAIKTLWIG